MHYANDGTYLSTVGSTGSGTSPIQFRGPEGLAVDPNGDVLVADPGNSRVDVLAPDLSYLRSVSLGSPPQQVAADANSIYVLSDTGSNLLLSKFSNDLSLTPEGTHTIAYGSGDDEMANTFVLYDQMAVDAAGNVLIDDSSNQRVVTYNPSLSFVRAWAEDGRAAGLTIGLYAGGEQVNTGDSSANGPRVLREDTLGNQQGTFGPVTIGSLSLQPWALGTDSAGNVFVADEGSRILRIAPTVAPSFSATPSPGVTSQTVTFDGSSSSVPFWSISDFRWDLDGSGQFATDSGSSITVSRRFDQPGTYTVGLQADAINGQTGQTTMSYVVGNSGAAFMAAREAQANTPVNFDATPSVIPYSSVIDYAWDFNGTSSYAVDGGTSPAISHTFATPGTYSVQLRVTRTGGHTDFASGTILVTPQPPQRPPGRVGVSINSGDYATDNPRVQVDLIWPNGAGRVVLSNDGGFGAAGGTVTRGLAPQVPWTLEQTGPDRLPKTIYVRFLGAGIDNVNFTDDIILDQTPPTLQSGRVVSSASASANAAVFARAHAKAARAKTHLYKIKIKAQDKIVGVCAVEVSARRSGGSVVPVNGCHHRGVLHLAKTVTIRSTTRPKFARVRNSAGDWSRWLKLRR